MCYLSASERGREENEETDKCSLPLTTARQLNCTSTAVLHLYFFPPSCSLNDSSSCSLDFSEQKIALSSMGRAMALSSVSASTISLAVRPVCSGETISSEMSEK